MADSRTRFDAGAEAWADYNQKPLGRIRQEVTWHNLAPYLPAVRDLEHPPLVLDVGGGSGELALRLIQQGYRVWLSDYAPAMLDQAQGAAQSLPSDVRDRLTLCPMPVDEVLESFDPRSFDAITCHTLIEFLPDPCASLASLAGLLRDSGLMSVSFVNRHAELLRQVWSKSDPRGALANLETADFCATLFGLPGTAHTAEEVGAWLHAAGLEVTGNYGVRAFADWVPRGRLDDPAFFEDMLHLEKAVVARSPYKELARYIQLIAQRPARVSRAASYVGFGSQQTE